VPDLLLDDVARQLSQPLSRKRALRLLGMAALAVTVPGLRPKAARATPADCVGDCSGRQGSTGTLCQHDLPTCTPHTCCSSDTTCCAGPASATCCDPGCTCAPDGRGFMSCQNCPRCIRGFTECGTGCCPTGRACAAGSGSSYLCCNEGQIACGRTCCDDGLKCVNPRTGQCSKCPPGQKACGKKCCPKGQDCCDAIKGVCCNTKRNSCCNTGVGGVEKWICCKAPNHCLRSADETGTSPSGSPRVCCPPDRAVPKGKGFITCCPPGYLPLGGKLVVPAGNLGGLCCRKDKTCGSGKNIGCCSTGSASAPELEQICCGGRCVGFKLDPNNCGSCGNVCASGNCTNGVCV
jgi:hypothetical protein